MEITEINIISDFEAGIKCLQSPSLISQFFFLGIEKIPQVYSFWKWGALILVIAATFSTIINKIKLLIIWVRTAKFSPSFSQPILQHLEEDFDFSDDDTSSSEVESDDEEFESTSLFEDREPVHEDSGVVGSSWFFKKDQGQYGNLSFAAGKNVVKLWDNFGFGLDFEDSSGSEISIWDLDKDLKISSFFGGSRQIPVVAVAAPAVVLSAEVNEGDNVVLGGYDMRVGHQIPAVYAEWGPRRGKVVGVTIGGVEKVYVTDGVSGNLTVADMRNVKTTLESLTESDGDTWWDAIVDEL